MIVGFFIARTARRKKVLLVKLNERQHLIYDILISILAVICVILIFVDYSDGISGRNMTLHRVIWGVFICDYVLRFYNAPKKGKFMWDNVFDLVALIPFHGIFPPASNLTLDKLLKFCNLLKTLAFLVRPLKKANRFFNTNGFKYVLVATFFMILGGGVSIHFAEGMSYADGIWWAFVTAATVGYGDISPHTFYGRVIAMILMVVGIGLLGSVTSTLTSFFLRQRNLTIKDGTIEMIQDRLTHFDELSDEDIDQIYALMKALKKKRG